MLEIDNISERPVAAGMRLLSLGRPDNLEIVADLLSSDAVRLAPGSRAIVERWGGAEPLEAILRRIEPSATTKVSALGIEEQRVDVLFDLTSPAAERTGLGDGFSVFLRVVEWQAADQLQVPLSAIFRVGPDWHVFVAEDGVAHAKAGDAGPPQRHGRAGAGRVVRRRPRHHPPQRPGDRRRSDRGPVNFGMIQSPHVPTARRVGETHLPATPKNLPVKQSR